MSAVANPQSREALTPALLAAWLVQSRDLLALSDRDGCVTWCNEPFRHATGLSDDGSANLLTLAPAGHTGHGVRESLAAALRDATLAEIELQLQCASGAELWVVARATGSAERLLWTLSDTTALRRETARAQRVAELLEMAQEFGRLGVWERAIPSGEGQWDRHVFGFWGLDPAAGTPDFAHAVERIHADDRKLLNYRESTRQAGRYAQRYRVMQPDGRTRWIHSQWEVQNSAEGRPVRAIGIMMDDTEVYNAAHALDAANAHMKLALDLGKIAIWRHDLQTQRLHYNDGAYALVDVPVRPDGVTVEEVRAITHPDDLQLVTASAEAALRSGRPIDVEARYRRSDGSWRCLLTRQMVQRGASGESLALLGVALDVTEHHLAEAAAQQAVLAEQELRAKTRFLSRMSHELRTPLNAVLGFTQLLQLEAGRANAETQLAKLAHIRSAGEQLLSLIDDVLDLSNLESGELQLHPKPVDLRALVAEVRTLVEALAGRRHVAVRAEAIAGVVRADPARLQQVLHSLLGNAINASGRGGQVVIDTRCDAARVVLGVRDTGRGLAPQQLAHLFEPFSSPGGDHGSDGAGVGLTIAKALVEAMGGSITVSSRVGEGTLFEVTLPAHTSPDTAPPAASADAAAGCATPGQLLYIEDTPVNVLLVEELVRSLSGLRIVSEATGSSGVERARVLQPDAILIDLQLPDFDGFEVLRRLREQPETALTRCIALSANALPEDIERGLSAGFTDYWTKPINFKTFLESLEKLFPVLAPEQTAIEM